ncbi:MAG: CBS domain-containing protein [Candidatus Methanomethylicia archaeon]|nr:CBS domain-containing protein [Candidatus Methanomethylicia archaeon]
MGEKVVASSMAKRKSVLDWASPINSALGVVAGAKHPYRLVLVDEKGKFKGILSARRILEILLGKRGRAIREGKGLKAILSEPIRMVIDESHQVFTTETSASTVLKFMVENMAGYVIIVDASNNYVGIIEEVDLLQRCRGMRLGIEVRKFMKPNVCVTPLSSTILEAAEMMLNERVRRLPLVTDGKVAGIVTISDVVRHIFSRTERLEALNTNGRLEDLLSEPIEGICRREVIACREEIDIGDAIEIALEKDISGLVVMNDLGELKGIISRIDMIVGLARSIGADTLVGMMK